MRVGRIARGGHLLGGANDASGVVQPVSHHGEVGENPYPLLAVSQLGRLGQELLGAGNRSGALFEDAEGGERPTAAAPVGRAGEQPLCEGACPRDVAGNGGVLNGSCEALGGQCRVVGQEGRSLEEGRRSRVP